MTTLDIERRGLQGLVLAVEPISSESAIALADDVVSAQRPAAGAEVPMGATVTVSVFCLPHPCPSPPPGRDETIYDPSTCATR